MGSTEWAGNDMPTCLIVRPASIAELPMPMNLVLMKIACIRKAALGIRACMNGCERWVHDLRDLSFRPEVVSLSSRLWMVCALSMCFITLTDRLTFAMPHTLWELCWRQGWVVL